MNEIEYDEICLIYRIFTERFNLKKEYENDGHYRLYNVDFFGGYI